MLMEEPANDLAATEAVFAGETQNLVNHLQTLTAPDLKNLMGISDKLAALNHDRYQQFDQAAEAKALYAFQGDVYQGLIAHTLSSQATNFAASHMHILSGLYGILRATDLIKPYRLEMGCGFSGEGFKNLYAHWTEKVTHYLNQHPAAFIVNLASKEYASVIDHKRLNKPLIDIQFYEVSPGSKPKIIGILAKKARGFMTRYICENQITTVEGLKGFNVEGYTFIPAASSDHNIVFQRAG